MFLATMFTFNLLHTYYQTLEVFRVFPTEIRKLADALPENGA